MGERLAKTDLAEQLLGLNQRLIDRLQPLPNCEISTYPPKVPIWVEIKWPDLKGSGSRGGKIKFYFAKEIDPSGDIKDFSPNMLTSHLSPSRLRRLNSFEGLSAVLTIMATIDHTARVLEEDLKHVVRTNKAARPYFERFQGAGLYDYCDLQARIEREPTTMRGITLYACQYPVEGIDRVIGKFVVEEAVGEILRTREVRMRDTVQKSRWRLIKDLVSG
jgi:hypothetical protein